MAYTEPDTALHHLKMAKSYLDDANNLAKPGDQASESVAAEQLQLLAQAAEHLNKARAIDPSEVLLVKDDKLTEREKLDQDYLNGTILLHEGVAHLNAALDAQSGYKYTDGSINKPRYKAGVARLEKARDALEKSFTYRAHSGDVLTFLAKAYQQLGDSQNYRRVLERHLQHSPDDIALHKQIKVLTQNPVLYPAFQTPGFTFTFGKYLVGLIVAGVALIVLAIVMGSGNAAGWGIVLLILAGASAFFKEKWEDWFG